MKNLPTNVNNLLTLVFILISCPLLFPQQVVMKEIEQAQRNGANFSKTGLLLFETNDIHSRYQKLEGLKQGVILKLDNENIAKLLDSQDDLVRISIPTSSRTQINLLLKKNEIFTPDFKLFTSDDAQHSIDYTPGLHYKGVVEGNPASLVALSIFPEHIMAMIATDEGNFIIGQIKDDPEKRHVYYNDRHLVSMFDFECGTEDDGLGYTFDQLKPINNSRDVNDCVRLHIEIDDNIVTDKGGASNATDYVTGMFNQSFIIYTNEGINMVISEIKAWTTDSPYSGLTQSEMLSSYKLNTDVFNGDLSQLVTYGAKGGSAAGTSGLCNGDPDLSKCFSHIDTSYNNFPFYSWTVFVITHEVGHLLGSKHTHACVWNGNNTAIDGCYAPAGSCPRPPIPSNGGTIMSYCYIDSTGSYIDLNLGFGDQPGTIIQNSVDALANCLSACGAPTSYCESTGSNSSTEFINKIVLGSINNLSGNNGGYEDFTSLSTTLNAGNTYTIALTPKFTGGNKIKSWRIWIDYNNDFDWYDTNEMVAQGTGNNTINLTFTVPANSISCTTRMRVSMKYTGFTSFCGTFPVGEVEDYTVIISGITEPTCSDGIQNQGETGVDCGGPCTACPVSCTDGILNQDETGVDCGGSCPPCSTCSDEIQNQGETGIDCGGPCPACPIDNTVLLASYFETGWDSWIDGGSEVTRVNSSNSYEGSYSIRIADNSGTQSAMTSPSFNLMSAVGVVINFHFYATSMEPGDDFWVRYNDGSGNWITVATFISGTHFVNNQFYETNVTIPDFIPTSAGSFRIQCDAGEKNDQVFIDAVTITKLNGTELIESGVSIQKLFKPDEGDNEPEAIKLMVYPNPVNKVLHISINGEIQSVRLISLEGTELKVAVNAEEENQIDVHHLASGLYFLMVQSGDKWYPVKFSIVK